MLEFIKNFKIDFPNRDIWVYSGGIFEDEIKNPIKKEILSLCDILIDGPFVKELFDPDLAFRGSSNQRIIDLKKTFENNNIIVEHIIK